MRRNLPIRASIAFFAISSVLTAYSQESAPEEARDGTRDNESAEQAATLETCATVPGAIEFNVLDDRHAYLRTRGSNHYLFTTEQCENIQKSFVRRQVQLKPYGRRVCENDGSYILYIDAGRMRTCYIQQVQRVDNRTIAFELADVPSDAVTAEPVELDSNGEVIDREN